ncbi:hypothetical protein SIL77_00060 [Exiguobacterium profundum]|uniref:hypothetical protein n=1 Tax=Exiguobacterium profundum TaxID=307643 RepID=UPI000AE787C9|nr:hypothetical protein [Exiguobacterium profundum]MDX5979665.1 hypothetical protein [Exiguobacterium profundum]
MKNLSAVILLCSSLWMGIYLYGEYAVSSVKFDISLVTFPVALFILSIVFFLSPKEGFQSKEHKLND